MATCMKDGGQNTTFFYKVRQDICCRNFIRRIEGETDAQTQLPLMKLLQERKLADQINLS